MSDKTEIEVKVCPFCGEQPIVSATAFVFYGDETTSANGYWVACLNSKCTVQPSTDNEEWPKPLSKDQAIKIWNTRY